MQDETGIALITGANKGIGLEVARQLGTTGWTVLIGSRNAERGLAARRMLEAEGIDAHFEELDVTNDASIEAAAGRIESKHGILDVLINNAGVLLEGDFPRPGERPGTYPSRPSETPTDTVRQTFATNVFGAISVINAMLPMLLRSARPRIVNVSSKLASLSLGAAFCQGTTKERYLNLLGYNGSKAALNAVTLQYAIELRDTAVKVNAVDPGHCSTDINGRLGDRPPSEAARIIVRMATLAADGPTGTFVAEDGPRAW